MVTTELTSRRPSTPGRWPTTVVACTAAVWTITLLGVAAGVVDPGLALARAPHAVLRPTLGACAAILFQNARVLCLPFLLTGFGMARGRVTRTVGDLAVILVLLGNAGLVGVELGRWGTTLIPYLPHLPLEWLAAGTAASSWVTARSHPDQPVGRRAVLVAAAAAVLELVAAAAVEVLLTPHAAIHTAYR